jgi:hypothetical protein
MAVLIALVFIGIVTAAMLRNTGSQSGASVGYGTMQTAAMNVKSGMVATESFFENSNDPDNVLELIQNALDNDSPFVGPKNKNVIGNEWFSSRLINVNGSGDDADYYFEIKSGRKGGRALKTAHAFYTADNSDGGGVTITNTMKYKAENAVYMKGNLGDGNDGMEVYGSVTFEGAVKFQNKQSIFHNDAYFNKGVDILKTPEFHDKAYFNDYLNLQNISGTVSPMFGSAVGINGNFSTQNNTTIKFNSDVWFNGDFIAPNGTRDDGIKLDTDNSNNNFYYSDKIPMEKSATKCDELCAMALPCPHSQYGYGCNNHPVKQSTRITGFGNINETSAYLGSSSTANIREKMGMDALEDRRDDELSIDIIPETKMYTVANVKSAQVPGSSSNCNDFSVMCIEAKWEEAKSAGNLYEDHLVVKVSASDYISNYLSSTNPPGILNKKIILILDDGAVLGGKFFKTGPESSTMIYVGKNAQLNDFSINGAFHGLIYIDSENVPTLNKNSIKSGANDTLVGALHSFSDKSFLWNTGDGSKPSVIKHDPNVLKNFSTLVKCKSEPCVPNKQTVDWTEEAKNDPDKKRVRLRAAGYYFH